jgi:hypothetical protein
MGSARGSCTMQARSASIPAFTVHDREDSVDPMNLMRHELEFNRYSSDRASNQEVGSSGPTTRVHFVALRVAPAVRGDWRTTLETRMAKPTQADAEAAVRVLINSMRLAARVARTAAGEPLRQRKGLFPSRE